VHDGIELMDLEQAIEEGAIVGVTDDEFDLEDGFHKFSMAIDEVIEDHDVIARILEC
jgi:hypothetical protein